MQRVFVVGCPRSGTTIVQAMLARHPDVFSLPETYFFEALLGDMEVRWGDRQARSSRRWYHRAGLAKSWGRRRLRDLEHTHMTSRHPRPVPRRWTACVRRYAAMLDSAARASDRTHWVEKSPAHLLFVEEIAACIPHARFVHVLRNGLDVVASVTDADMKQEVVGGFGGGIVQWARRWNHAMAVHRSYLGQPAHHFLCLEDLIGDTAAQWESLRAFLALDARKSLLPQPGYGVADLREEPWKVSAVPGVVRRVSSKAQALFGQESLAWLRRYLDDYRPIRAAVNAQQGVGGATREPLDFVVRHRNAGCRGRGSA